MGVGSFCGHSSVSSVALAEDSEATSDDVEVLRVTVP